MKTRWFAITVAFLVLAMLACNATGGEETAVPTQAAPPTQISAPTQVQPTQPPPPTRAASPTQAPVPTSSSGGGTQPQPGNATITLQNNSGQTIWYAYVSPSTDPNWGEDDLGSATVPDGGSFVFTVPAGTYDLKAEGSGHTVIATQMGVNVSGNYVWIVTGGSQPQPQPGNATITLQNNSGQTIWYAYVSPSTDPNWGDDDLGSATVPAGGTFVFTVPAGTYDLKAEGSGHTVIATQMGVNVSGNYNWYVP